MKQPVREAISHWYLPLITGILFIIAGVWALRTPAASYATLAILFACMFLLSGIMAIMYALSNRKVLPGWGWTLAVGIVDMLVGLLMLSTPAISMLALPLYVGFGILFRAIMAIGTAFELRKQHDSQWGWLAFIGFLGAMFAFMLIRNPVFAGLTIATYTAIALIILGIAQITASMRLRKLNNLFHDA
ncbi:HdeD family acid-resistance protein [Polluticoccus soli]|uniref:HdeD family acid-resistance protein n=1 Tax=Polluticoccus soli TaxID=3034150 RepID=UPI0023E0A8E7|nr:HdeD family acid-resistance protein [Flavipsychrobacter sp. JY13-12]